MTKLNHYTQNPKSGGKPKQIIALLHGYGSNGRDLISLAPYWQEAAPDALFISPDAPFSCEMGEGANENMRQWFSLMERTPEKYLEGVNQARPILDTYLDEALDAHGLTDRELILVGFSQGTMMSLYTGLRRKGKIAGILGYSGSLIGAEELNEDGINKPPIRLIHGESDDVVTIDKYHHAVKNLTENGFDVSGHTTPNLTHSIDGAGVESGSKFISKIVNDIK